MVDYQKGSHTVHDIKYRLVWDRYKVLKGDVAKRARNIIRQSCLSRGITILKGSVGQEHIHLLLSCPATLSPAKIAQYLKGRSSRLIQDEFPHLKKRYWGQHLWARGYFCATVGTVTDEIVKAYIEQQEKEAPEENFKIVDEED